MAYFITFIIVFLFIGLIFSMKFERVMLSLVFLWIYSFIITPSLSYEYGVYDSDILKRYTSAIDDLEGVWVTFVWTGILYMILIFFIGVFGNPSFQNLKNKTPYIQATLWAVFIEFILRYSLAPL